MQTTIANAATPPARSAMPQTEVEIHAGIMPLSTRTASQFHPTSRETAAQQSKREAQRIAARTLRLALTARACRRINNVLRERKQAAARRADRA